MSYIGDGFAPETEVVNHWVPPAYNPDYHVPLAYEPHEHRITADRLLGVLHRALKEFMRLHQRVVHDAAINDVDILSLENGFTGLQRQIMERIGLCRDDGGLYSGSDIDDEDGDGSEYNDAVGNDYSNRDESDPDGADASHMCV